MMLFARAPLVCCWIVALSLIAQVGCEPPQPVGQVGDGPPVPPAPPDSPPAAGIRVNAASDLPAPPASDSALPAEGPLQQAVESGGAIGFSALPAFASDEDQIRAVFAERLAAFKAADGKRILAVCHPSDRSVTLIGMASMGGLLAGPNSELARMVEEAGLLAERYQQMFRDVQNVNYDVSRSQALLDEAAAKIRDPERLASLACAAMQTRTPEARYELVDLTVQGDEAAGVQLLVTHFGTAPAPFAAGRIDGRWYLRRTSPAAEAKVKEYEANPTPATVKLPARTQVRITAAQLSQEFQSNPSGAAQKYGTPFDPLRGPFGGPPGPFAGPGAALSPPPLPMDRKDEFVLEGTVAFCETNRHGPVVYFVTPAGSHHVNMMVLANHEDARILAAAETGQTMTVVLDYAGLNPSSTGGQAAISISGRQIELSGEPAEPYGPLSAPEFLRAISDPTAAAKLQGKPIIVEGTAVLSLPQALIVGLDDGAGKSIGASLRESELKWLKALKQGQKVRLQGAYVPPASGNQVMLRACVFLPE